MVIALASRSKFAQMGLCQNTDKPASGPCARRGSNPFPGANLLAGPLLEVFLKVVAACESVSQKTHNLWGLEAKH